MFHASISAALLASFHMSNGIRSILYSQGLRGAVPFNKLNKSPSENSNPGQRKTIGNAEFPSGTASPKELTFPDAVAFVSWRLHINREPDGAYTHC